MALKWSTRVCGAKINNAPLLPIVSFFFWNFRPPALLEITGNTIERVPTPYLPNQPLRILVQNFSQVPRCKVFFQSMQHRAVSHQQLLPLRKHSKKSQASFTNQECLSSQPPEEQDDSQIEAGFTITPHPAPPPNMSNPPSRRRTRWQLNRSSLHNHTIRFFLFSKDSKKFSQLRHTN